MVPKKVPSARKFRLLNTYTHRGMKVCRDDEGNTTVFTCPYHGWSFSTEGRLVGVPYYGRRIASASRGHHGT